MSTSSPPRGQWGGYFQTWSSPGAYGAPGTMTTESSGTGSAFLDTLAPYAQLATGIYAEMQDPVREAAVLEAKLQNAIERGATQAEIRLLQAKLSAAQQAAGLSQATTQSRWEWTALGKAGTVVGIGVGLAVIYALARAVK